MTETQEISYFQQRMLQIGANNTNSKLKLFSPETHGDRPNGEWKEEQIFTEDKKGNIVITMYDLQRRKYMWWEPKSKTAKMGGHVLKSYQLVRLKEPKGDNKYLMPRGKGTMCFYPPKLVKAFEDKKHISTLYLTEGVFKSFKASLTGLMVIGLTSITHYKDQETKDLHPGIIEIIKECRVENLCILWDGDCLNISLHDLEFKQELTKRPAGFFNAAKSIRQLAQSIVFQETRKPLHIWFAHIKSEVFDEKPKGLDDLLEIAAIKGKTDAVVRELRELQSNFYFFTKDISASTANLQKYFKLHDEEMFYNAHSDKIQQQEFLFKKDVYCYNEGKSKLEILQPGWAKDVKWIGDDFFVVRTIPGANRDRQALLPRKKGTLTTLHGGGFTKYLHHYDGFCNIPNHFAYQQIISNFYNRYFPFRHDIYEGDFSLIIEFLQHIFGNEKLERNRKKIREYELGLDYLQLLLTQPRQTLPVLCLFSPENATGKSTFGKLCNYIFGDNCVQIGNADLQSDFNEVYSDKLIAICEETLLERKKDVERIKSLSTSDQITVNPKGQRQFSIDFFCKFQFYSNRKRMLYVTKHDDRFWIRQVNKPKRDIPNLLDKMKEQVPAFVFFLKNRKLSTDKESRMWFHHDWYKTDILKKMVKVNEPQDVTDLRDGIKNMFLDFREEKIVMPLKSIKEEFFSKSTSDNWIKEILEDHLVVNKLTNENGQSKQIRGKYPIWVPGPRGNQIRGNTTYNGRPYLFLKSDFVTENDIPEYEDYDFENDFSD